jgi:hypothetical protein
MAVAKCPAMSDIDSPGLMLCFRLTQYTRKSPLSGVAVDRNILRCHPSGTSDLGVRPSTLTSGGPSPIARYAIPSPSSPADSRGVTHRSYVWLKIPDEHRLLRHAGRTPRHFGEAE